MRISYQHRNGERIRNLVDGRAIVWRGDSWHWLARGLDGKYYGGSAPTQPLALMAAHQELVHQAIAKRAP